MSRLMISRGALVAGLALAAVLVSARAGADSWSAEERAVIAAMQQWEVAVESGDYDALADLYTEDAIYYPNQVAPVIGRDAIIERNRGRGNRGTVEITQQVDDVEIKGDWAVYSCAARVEVDGGAGESAVGHVRVLLLMERGADGQWRIHRDIDNQPPAS
ncbi:YybH family protein [Elongatibacter sediminis]|uniref:SgcJ/EcaC family oxidoreductase n=1 Tax=Elongatibacter sediminis TaxID=3119006 RepID=A0AAW9RDH6_9GAMM